ncbi:MAG TPA: hypothetical protein VK943_20170 [Arenibaculum sp.]|nr:hypothetical protein [Arenibaculum sp.]
MAARTVFVMQTFKAGARGALVTADGLACRTEDEARRRAEKAMATGRIEGAHVVRQEVDEAAGDYGEPEVLATFGRVPEMVD